MDTKAHPETLVLSGPTGFTFLLQGLFRYTRETINGSKLIIAIENPQTDYSPAWAGTGRQDTVPDFHFALERVGDRGHLKLRSLLHVGKAVDDLTGTGDSSAGWGIGLSGSRQIGLRNEIRFDVKHGIGLGRYIFDGGLGQQGWAFDGINLIPVSTTGGYLNHRFRWNEKWRSNLIFGVTGFNNPSISAATTNRLIQSFHVNLLFNPIKKITTGIEYSYADRQIEDGRKGRRNRIQLSAKYAF